MLQATGLLFKITFAYLSRPISCTTTYFSFYTWLALSSTALVPILCRQQRGLSPAGKKIPVQLSTGEHLGGRSVFRSDWMPAACSIVFLWTILCFLCMSPSSDRASFCSRLLTPVPRTAAPAPTTQRYVGEGRRKGKSQLTFVVPEMCVPKGTFVTVVLSLICAIISLTLSVGGSIGFTGGSSSICVQKTSL